MSCNKLTPIYNSSLVNSIIRLDQILIYNKRYKSFKRHQLIVDL